MTQLFHHSRVRVAGTLVAATSVCAALACADTADAPTAVTAQRSTITSGEATSSLWLTRNGVLTYVGSARGNGEIVSDSGKPLALQSSAQRSITLSPHLLDSVQSSIAASNLVRRLTSGETRRAVGSAARFRPTLPGSRTFKHVKDGKTFEVQVVDAAEGRGQPPRSLLVSVNGRAVSLHQYTFEKTGGSWTPSHSRTTVFDSLGHVAAVSDNEFNGVKMRRVGSVISRSAELTKLASAFGNVVGGLFAPDALYAAEEDDEAKCLAQKITVTMAEVGWSLALANLIAASAACVTTIITCPALIQAQIALTMADVALGVAFANLYACLNPPPPPPPPPPPTGSGSGSGGETCGWVYFEVSYDDGNTWEAFDQQWLCY